MSNAPQTFDFNGLPVDVHIINGEPWWVAKDICEILEIKNSRRTLMLLDEDEKGVHTVNTLGGPQQVATINESGLYSLILRSRKAEAKAFKRWVTHEVLPSIRKTGSYATEAQAHKLPQTMSEALRLAADLADAKERLELKVREMAPKANFADAVVKAVNSQTIDQAAKILGTGEKRLFKFLREHGYLRGNNEPYQKYLDEGDGLGYFRLCLNRYRDPNGEIHVYTRTLVTGKGIEYLQRKYFGGQMRGMEPEKPLTLQVWTA